MKVDCVAKWIDEAGDVPIMLVAGKDSFHKEYYNHMVEGTRSKTYNTNESQEETDELIKGTYILVAIMRRIFSMCVSM